MIWVGVYGVKAGAKIATSSTVINKNAPTKPMRLRRKTFQKLPKLRRKLLISLINQNVVMTFNQSKDKFIKTTIALRASNVLVLVFKRYNATRRTKPLSPNSGDKL